jgi:hypothetical protein
LSESEEDKSPLPPMWSLSASFSIRDLWCLELAPPFAACGCYSKSNRRLRRGDTGKAEERAMQERRRSSRHGRLHAARASSRRIGRGLWRQLVSFARLGWLPLLLLAVAYSRRQALSGWGPWGLHLLHAWWI